MAIPTAPAPTPVPTSATTSKTQYVTADGVEIFYRSAGPVDAPVLLLLHGFPTSSHQYRNLMTLLAPRYRVIAPDLPGFGFTVVPESRNYTYTFANLGKTMVDFVDALGLTKFAMYIFDYGAPTGFHLALSRPDAITAIITQNGNAYVEGLGPGWEMIKAYWTATDNHDSAAEAKKTRDALRPFFALDAIKSQYTSGVPDTLIDTLDPLAWQLDTALMARPGIIELQLDLFLNYRQNVSAYPKWQAFLRQKQLPILAIWGQHDAFFLPEGAEAFKRDVPCTQVVLLDTGHFALETHLVEIATQIEAFLPMALRVGSKRA